jgi:hypothetical protein
MEVLWLKRLPMHKVREVFRLMGLAGLSGERYGLRSGQRDHQRRTGVGGCEGRF